MISLAVTMRLALRALRAHKMRSALTMLGMIIGVAAIITMLAVGSGARLRIAEQISSMGTNIMIILPGASTSGGMRMGSGTTSTLTVDDAQAVLRECPQVVSVAPIYSGVAQIVYGSQNWSTSIIGSTSSFLDVREWGLAGGRPFIEQDERNATKVALIGKTVADNLFGSADPVGQTIRIKNMPFMVIGLLAAKGQTPDGRDQDDVVVVPLTTAQKKLFGAPIAGAVRIVVVKTREAALMDEAEQQITALLRQRHNIRGKQDNDFTVRNLTQIMQTAEQAAKVMSLLLGAIASVSLIVGGIGIMNIMLVSVTERTREIGIRMAVGALRADIRLQFLAEAVTLSMAGGLIGVLLGTGGAKLVAALADWPTIVTPESVALSFGFSCLVGVVFGFYPAYKASTLRPIDALRYE